MDIKELEFIRDFSDMLSHLEKDIDNVVICCDNGKEDEEIREVNLSNIDFLLSVSHQCELLGKLFGLFKESVDEKYWNVWVKAYPHITENYKENE